HTINNLDLHSLPTRRSSDISIVKSKITSIEKNAQKALSVYQGTVNPYILFNADGYDMSDEKTVDVLNSDSFYKNSQYIYDIALADRKSTRLNSSHVSISYAV